MEIGKVEFSARLTVVRRLGAQASIGPNGVRDQSLARTKLLISLPPTSHSLPGFSEPPPIAEFATRNPPPLHPQIDLSGPGGGPIFSSQHGFGPLESAF